jgi:hypothetical protein
MRSRTACLLLLMMTLGSCRDSGPVDDVAEVRSVFDGYMQALARGDGATAADLVDQNTIDYHERMVQLARTADSTEVARLDVMERIMVLGLRMQVDRETLRRMDGRQAVALGSSAGLAGGSELAALDIGAVTVDGDRASAPIRLGGFPVPAKFHFTREQEGWRMDVTSLFDISRMAFDQMALRRGESSNEWLMELLEETSGTPPPADLWHP